MKAKVRSIILIFCISILLVPGWAYQASIKQNDSIYMEKNKEIKTVRKIRVFPKTVHIPKGSDEKELRDMITVYAYYKDEEEPRVINDYTTNYKAQKQDKKHCYVTIEFIEGKCVEKTCVKVSFCVPIDGEKSSAISTAAINQETTNGTMMAHVAAGDEDINFPYISGYGDHTFRPNQAVTREELATMLARLITKNSIPSEENQYEDLYDERFSTDAVNYITRLGVMSPETKTLFKPDRKVSYQEFEEIVKHINAYIKNPDTKLPSGKRELTRAETVITLNSLFRVQCNTNHETFPFRDVKPDMPEYHPILCATQPQS
ncbi:MAG: S-layer homology domain-containing protein [Cellulosilyticum sp.]|nr:S-layer homology domain-containing protein [Cellulosilyticum sp.]